MNSLNINVCKVMKRKTLIEEDKKKIEISNKIDEIYLIMKENVHCNNWGVLDGFSSTILFLYTSIQKMIRYWMIYTIELIY